MSKQLKPDDITQASFRAQAKLVILAKEYAALMQISESKLYSDAVQEWLDRRIPRAQQEKFLRDREMQKQSLLATR